MRSSSGDSHRHCLSRSCLASSTAPRVTRHMLEIRTPNLSCGLPRVLQFSYAGRIAARKGTTSKPLGRPTRTDMTEIALPPEFKKACRNLGQNIGYEQPSMEVIVNYALSNLDRNDAAVIRKFLDDELLSGRRDDRALMETWWSTPASIFPRRSGTAPVLAPVARGIGATSICRRQVTRPHRDFGVVK